MAALHFKIIAFYWNCSRDVCLLSRRYKHYSA